MNEEKLTTSEFREALSRAGWTMGLYEFCNVLGWNVDSYSRSKFLQFQEMCRLINLFDPLTLNSLVEAGRKANV